MPPILSLAKGAEKLLRIIGHRSDLALVLLLLTIIFMIILPLPTWLIDVFIGCNMAIVLLTLAIVFYLKNPSELSTLPALLLFATVFRLAISISTTRLILIQADAGEIIQAFGDFVVSGSVIIGMVVFLIITVVQFIVITKGSERVAEVSARFALDSLPGKQMSIDSDMRAGEIDLAEAKRRRNKLRVENDFYGAMDGAMKFVKGDSIAGLIIIAVNLIGGVGVGVGQNGMGFGQAVQVYSVLTVGDGLVSQIPALIMAIGAGIAITRIAKDEEEDEADLGSDIIYQLSGGGKELAIAGFAMMLFAFVPGFPKVTFFALAALFGASAYFVSRRKRIRATKIGEPAEEGKIDYQVPTSVRLELARDLADVLDIDELTEQLHQNRVELYSQIGIPFPAISISELVESQKHNWILRIEGLRALTGDFPLNKVNSTAEIADLEAAGIEYEIAKQAREEFCWVERSHTDELLGLGLSFQKSEETLARLVTQELPYHAEDIIGVEEANILLGIMEKRYSTLVTAVRKVAPPEKLVLVLRPLVSEKVPLTNFRVVLEAILEWAPKEDDPATLSEFVRAALARQISDQYANEDRKIPAYLLDPDTESTLRDALMHNSLGSFMALTAEQSRHLLEKIKQAVAENTESESSPVLLTAMDIRVHLKKFLKNNGVDYPVLSQKEVYNDFEVYPLGIIGAP